MHVIKYTFMSPQSAANAINPELAPTPAPASVPDPAPALYPVPGLAHPQTQMT